MKQLVRTLDLGPVIAISMGAMIGSGIFVLPGMATTITGSTVWLAYIAAGVCALPAALATAELATAMPTSGGKYFFIDRTFGPLAGTISGIGLWLTLLLKSAFALVGFGMYLAVLVDLPLKPTALALLGVIILLNLLGARTVGKALKWVVGACVFGMAFLVAAGSGGIETARLAEPSPNGLFGFVSAVGFVFVSFAGVTKVAAIAEEVKNPGRNLPLGILISLAIVTFMYGAVILVLVGTVPADELAGDLHPIYLLANRIGTPVLGTAVAVLAVVMMTSMANAGLLAASRFPFAMSRDDLVPKIFAAVSPRFNTPAHAVIISGAVVGAAIVLVEVEEIAKLASSFLIMMFIAVNCAVIVLRESDSQWYRPAFRAPLYPATQIFGILNGLVLLVFIGGLALLAAGVIAVPGAILYLLYGRRRTSRRSVARRIGDSRRPTGSIETDDLPDRDRVRPGVIVVLVGSERSPETVVEIGTAISGPQPLSVIHITEVPEQIFLASELQPNPTVGSLRRRIATMADKTDVEINFDSIVTHDLIESVRTTSERSRCTWILKAWRSGGDRGFFLRSPLAWSLYGLPCNLALFKDAGVRHIRKILVLAEPGPNDALVVSTCDHLARLWGAELTFVGFVPDGVPQTIVQSRLDYFDELRHLCRTVTHHQILRGTNEIQAIVDLSAAYDLLVTGETEGGFFRSVVLKTRRERLTARAACSVLRLKTPRARTHAKFKAERAYPSAANANPIDFLTPLSVEVRLEETRKEALFERFGEIFARSLPKVSAEAVTAALWAREEMQNTAVGDGLALPHGTLDELDDPVVGIFTTANPVGYDGPGDAAAQVFFVTLCPSNKRLVHLQILASLARLVENTDFVALQRAARTSEEAIAALHGVLGID